MIAPLTLSVIKKKISRGLALEHFKSSGTVNGPIVFKLILSWICDSHPLRVKWREEKEGKELDNPRKINFKRIFTTFTVLRSAGVYCLSKVFKAHWKFLGASRA